MAPVLEAPRPASRLLRAIRERLKLRVLIALCGIAAGAFLLPRAWSSSFVVHRRAAFHLKQAEAHQAAREPGPARAEYRAALRLEPFDTEARGKLADMESALGNWELAFLELESLTELHPEQPEAFITLARMMLGGGLLEAPEAVLDAAIAAAPARPDAHILRADIRDRLGRYSGAHFDAQAAVARAPKDPTAWAMLARTTARTQGKATGIEAARRYIATVGSDPILKQTLELIERGQEPAPAPARRFRADAQMDRSLLGSMTREQWPGRLGQEREELDAQLGQKAWPEAQRIVDRAAQEYPDSVFAPFMAGTLESARGNLDAAEKRFFEALAVEPRLPAVIAALAQTWSRKQGPWFAGENLMKLAERDPGLSFARYVAARAYVQSRDPIRAEAALRRGLKLQPDSPVPYQHLADYYFGLDRAADALEICQQGLERFPQDLDLLRMQAQIETGLSRPEEAIRIYQAILAGRPEADLARYRLALLLVSQEKDESAQKRAKEIAKELGADQPSDPTLLDMLGWVLFRTGDVHRGRELLEAAVKVAPEDPSLHFHLGAVYLEARNIGLARKELTLAVDSPHPFPERLDALRLLRDNSKGR